MSQIKDKEKLYKFLIGLDSKFAIIRTKILAINPIPNLGNTYHLIVEDEIQMIISAEKKP